MDIDQVISTVKSFDDNTIKRYVTDEHVSTLKCVLGEDNNTLWGVALVERLEDCDMRSRVANQLAYVAAFVDNPTYETAHILTGNKSDAQALLSHCS